MSRSERKIDHIRHALGHEREFHNHFDDVQIVHQSLAELDFHQISIASQVGELNLSSPLFVNAMTGGGGRETERINRELAVVAKQAGISMAVGSQMSALKNPEERRTYEVVREENPEGILFANVGSEATPDQAVEAVRMLGANALQIHINTLQELIMPEGDRDFTKRSVNIKRILERSPVPVIVKEVGYGMSKETVDKLYDMGVRYIDVGGRGGTNFSKVENMRRERPFASFNNWGIPTPSSILENAARYSDLHLFASGGIRNGLDGSKALVLGAQAFGMAGALLKVLVEEGPDNLLSAVDHIHQEVKMAMMLLNCTKTQELKGKPYVLYGQTKDWYDQRNP
ncbi:type 2 isopentenyl-diphosphate Delta-isomerase [Halobacillus sp. ACCC02827]|uniref:type 2 isopentenyl-diphosphate Delta-isomerase n=1 Tax=Halobacillus sp. ACCC02827 TaxID=3052090 RepID=UPI0025702D87|nr:type 2 isopentenyl-diphosphate Delta-isomerase [Halobacillus sp. ACCC02827]WJE14108.1 type 2 isopentenyl-diphosphate Delta-isomerase [Halobacillus sp. ACCC02827]